MASPRIDRAISVRQPWAFAIAAGLKTTENRGVWCNYRGSVAIHASLQRANSYFWPDRTAADAYQAVGANSNLWEAQYPHLPSAFSAPQDPRLALGGVIAVVEIVGCHYATDEIPIPGTRLRATACCPVWGQRWHHGKTGPKPAVHIELANARPFARAVPMRGRLGVPWRMNEDQAAAVEAQLREVDARA